MAEWKERITSEGEIELVQEAGDLEIVYGLEPKRVDIVEEKRENDRHD